MKWILILIIVMHTVMANAQISFDNIKNVTKKTDKLLNKPSLSNEDIVNGLKNALQIGAVNASTKASSKGGFNTNNFIRITFPEDLQNMKSMLQKAGMQQQIMQFENKLNETAEEASHSAKDIFISTIVNMKVDDALFILQGDDNEATKYLIRETSQKLYDIFLPVVIKAMDKTMVGSNWKLLNRRYNSIPFVKKNDIDLNEYITQKTLSGLFILIEKEEKNIRNHPSARVTEILQKVFQ